MTRDIFLMDEVLVPMYSDEIQMAYLLLGFFVTMIVIVPYMLVMLLVVTVSVIVSRWYIMPATRLLRRLELVTRSPLFGFISNGMSGLIVIRSYKSADRFRDEMAEAVTQNFKTYFNF